MQLEIRAGRRAVRVTWTSRTAPTAAEKRALVYAVQAGKLRSGDRVSRARGKVEPVAKLYRRQNPAPKQHHKTSTAAARSYERFHWGNPARKKRVVRLPSYQRGLYELGELVAVEYLTHKGDEEAIWVHKFGKPRPKLTATPSGRLGPIIGGRARVEPRGIVG